jgi:tight adherence protein C
MNGSYAEIVKLIALVATFGTISLTTYVLLRTRAQRASIRAGLEGAILDSPSVAHSRPAVMRGSFAKRIAGPSIRQLAQVVYRFGPQGLSERTRRRLTLAGLGDRVEPDTFFALSVAAPVGSTAFLLTMNAIGGIPLYLWLAVPATAFLPKLWLTNRVEARQQAIRLALPDTLDLLTIAVEAGLGFDAALSRVVRAIPGPLTDELYRMLQELKIGIPRAKALRNLAERTDIPDLDQFITAVAQADTFGISVGRVLRVQAHQLRQKRSQVAEERAAKTPVKLLFPLLLCIFPALFTVLVGPAAIKIMDGLLGKL